MTAWLQVSTKTEPVVVIGPGALGLLLGALLQAVGQRVVFLARDATRAAHLSAAGLTLVCDGERSELPLDARTVPPPTAAAVLLCVKVRDTQSACRLGAQIPDAPVVVFQNGLGRGVAVGEALGTPERVVVALTRQGATRGPELGTVVHAGRGQTTLAPLVAGGTRAGIRVAEILGSAMGVECVDDLARAEWEKLGVNAAINALTAVARCPNGVLVQVPALRELAQQAAEEVAVCAQAAGIEGEWGPVEVRQRWEAVAQATAENRSSSLQDIENNRVTEVSAINGAVAVRAGELGCSAPVNSWLAQLVRGLEQISPRR